MEGIIWLSVAPLTGISVDGVCVEMVTLNLDLISLVSVYIKWLATWYYSLPLDILS